MRTGLLVLLIICAAKLAGQLPVRPSLPVAYLIGEHEQAHASLTAAATPLLDVCNGNVEEAWRQWRYFLSALESHAQSQDLDLRGVKLWLHVFWSADGRVQHMAFYLKPNSKAISTDLLRRFFSDFASRFRQPLEFESSYQLYTTVSFPVFVQASPAVGMKPTPN
ncbi:MAG: hypothetical protein KatS3mg029_0833 [Saprospiraceae bacterium]|nr:MAG: hypothetical protein KatS3mg029_0833 [Saprospiraceae bacterium]